MRYDSLAFRILRHFALNPGLHRAVDIVGLGKAFNVCASCSRPYEGMRDTTVEKIQEVA